MATELELALQAGGKVVETDLQKAFKAGGKRKKEGVRGMTAFMNRAIASAVGAPVDIVAGAISLIPGVDIPEPFGGRKSIERGMEAIGIGLPEEGAKPKAPSEYIGRSVGEIAALSIPSGLAIKALTKGAGLASMVAKPVWDAMVKNPFLTMAGEIGAGVGAGVGRYIGEERYPETPIVRSATELVGGVVGGVVPTAVLHTPTALGVRATKGLAKKLTMPFTEAGAKYRAGKFLKAQVKEPGVVAERVIKKTIGKLPPVVATGEKRLNAMLQTLRNADPITDADLIERTSKSAYKLLQETRVLGVGTTEQFRYITEKRIAALTLKMDKRILASANKAQTKLNLLNPAKRKAYESRIVKDELEKVMLVMRKKKNQLWLEVPKDVTVNYNKSKAKFFESWADLPSAQKDDMPKVASKFFRVRRKKEPVETVKELWGLRSKLLETARKSRSTGDYNTARISDEMADVLLEDLGAKLGKDITPSGEKLRAALVYTHQFEERFHQGITGKIVGYHKTGAPAISPDIVLDVSIGKAGAKGAVDINKIIATPEARNAAKRYITRSFTDYAADKTTGKISPLKAQQWMKNNEAVLDNFPDLKTVMSDAMQAQKLANNTRVLMEARKVRLQNSKISTAANFLNIEPGVEISKILKAPNSVRAMRELARQARKDPSGEAIEGLKGSFIDHILEKSSIGAYNELGEQTLSGRAMATFVNKNRIAIREFFPQDRIVRMEKIARELSKLEIAETKFRGVDIEFEDIASNMLRLVSRVGGAQMGRWVAKMTGGGTVQTPGIFSERFKNFASWLNKDRAFQLVNDAITSKDGELLRALLLPIDKPHSPMGLKNLAIINKQINLWLIGTGSRVMEDIELEEKQGG